MLYPPVPTKTVLVTGASSGIGRATALLLRDHGWTVFPTARRPEDLDALRAEGFDPLPLELSDSASSPPTTPASSSPSSVRGASSSSTSMSPRR